LENAQQDTLLVMDADGLGSGTTCWVATGNCDSDPDILDYWDFYYDTGNHDDAATDQLVSDVLANDWGVFSTSRAYHLYEAGSPAGEYGSTVERLGMRSLSREWNGFSLTDTVYGLEPTGYLDALNTLYFDDVTQYVSYNSPVTVVDTSGEKPFAIDENGVYHYADSIIVTVSLGVLKAEVIDFVPDLPASKLNAIDTIGVGKGMKISVRLSSQIWDSKFMNVLTDGPSGNCWAVRSSGSTTAPTDSVSTPSTSRAYMRSGGSAVTGSPGSKRSPDERWPRRGARRPQGSVGDTMA